MMLAEMICCVIGTDDKPRLPDPTSAFAGNRLQVIDDAVARLGSVWPALIPLVRACTAKSAADRCTAAQALSALLGAHPCRIPMADVLTVNTDDVTTLGVHLVLASATLNGARVTAMVRVCL